MVPPANKSVQELREERHYHCMAEQDLYIPESEEDPSTTEEQEEEESVEPDDTTPAENQEEPVNDDWLCPSCGKSPCEFFQAQEESERVGRIMSADTSQAAKWFHTYKFLTRRLHGQLGGKKRIPLPPCCKQGSRDLFPSKDATYVGFRHANP